jgi:serine/threonine-protein kinase
MPAIPPSFGPYRIEYVLHEGKLQTVYRATGPDGRAYAIKVPQNPEAQGYIRNEAAKLAKLTHPAIIKPRGLVPHEGIEGLVLDYMPERASRLFGKRALPELFTALYAACDAVGHLHSRVHDNDGTPDHIVHRDIKLENILIDRTGVAKLSDFEFSLYGRETDPLSKEGLCIGTVPVMAPELFIGDPHTIPSDLYALGVTAYTLLTGQEPYPSMHDDWTKTFLAAQEGKASRPSESNTALPRELDKVILKAIAPKPQHRYSSAAEFKTAIHEAMTRSRRPWYRRVLGI